MDNAHLKVELVLNEDENEEEKRFNEFICYDSGDSDEESSYQNDLSEDTTESMNDEIVQQNPPQSQQSLTPESLEEKDRRETAEKKSNAAQMRKYRAKQRSDPIRYKQYLERERMRNYKRKYEKRILAAQVRAQILGIPYIVLGQPLSRRGRRPMFGDGVSIVLPAKYDDAIDDESNSYHSDDTPMIPVHVELHESDELYKEPKPNISVVNINKLMNQPRSALQTLLPQEVNDRERVSNFIKLEHDYVKHKTETKRTFSMLDGSISKRWSDGNNKRKTKKYELQKLQEQCRSFGLNGTISESHTHRKPNHQPQKTPARTKLLPASAFDMRNRYVQHEDLDDLFKELAEVATKEPPKKKHSSPHKKSPRQHSRTPRQQSYFQQIQDDGKFSLTVSMPVQPIGASKFVSIKSEPNSPTDGPCDFEEMVESKCNSVPNVDQLPTLKPTTDVYNNCNEDSIEIKLEPIHSDDDYL